MLPLQRLLVASAATSVAAAIAQRSSVPIIRPAVPAFAATPTARQRRKSSHSLPLAKSRTAMAASGETSTDGSGAGGGDAGGGRGLFLFDFDGVICDSCDECTVAALRTVRSLGVLDDDDEAILDGAESPPRWLLDEMREIRPAIEVGWQIPVMLAVLMDRKKGGGTSASGMTTESVITNYESLVSATLAKWGKTDREMIEAFGGVRDRWMADDLNSWLEANTFYSGIPEGVSACRGEAAVVTTKQQRFAIALMRHAGVKEEDLPDDDIYGLGMYKAKSDVIVDRMQKGRYGAGETHFFEDRWPTLAKCLKDERLEGVRFYLCDWGYVAPHERDLAEAEERVEILPLDRFRDAVAST